MKYLLYLFIFLISVSKKKLIDNINFYNNFVFVPPYDLPIFLKFETIILVYLFIIITLA